MNSPFAIAMLALEAQKVIQLRLVKLTSGGREAADEAQQMIAEKISASFEAAGTLMIGGSIDTVVARYREHVAANADRLTS
jgi:heptaprenylglyceryl phosphate synthase